LNVKLLIDAIVRQTTVLLAQLSTAAGVRAPLAHVVDQVFLELAREIEAQGVGRKVVADMFGLALRGYQKKMQRLGESHSARERTLWEAMLDYVEREGPSARRRVLERFRHDDEAQVLAVLNDLLQSGLVASDGRGDDAVYRVTTQRDRARLDARVQAEARVALAWLQLYRAPAKLPELARELGCSQAEAEQAVQQLCADGSVERDPDGLFRAPRLLIPVGSGLGWEAAVRPAPRPPASRARAQPAARHTRADQRAVGRGVGLQPRASGARGAARQGVLLLRPVRGRRGAPRSPRLIGSTARS